MENLAFFSGDLYFDALNLEPFQICLIISQSLGEDSCWFVEGVVRS